MSNKQLYEKIDNGYSEIYPISNINNILDENNEATLAETLKLYNHVYATFDTNQATTRLSVPVSLRKHGLWITYEYQDALYTEMYIGVAVDVTDDSEWSKDTNWELIPNLKYVEDASSRIPNGSILPEQLSNSVLEMIASSGTVITNLADDEDLEEKPCHVIKLKDRSYNPTIASGLGYKILRKNWVNGVNVLTQDMISETNTRYEIRYDFDLNGETITIPEGCVLDFQGGSFSNGTITSNSKLNILAHDYKIFKDIIFEDYAKYGVFNVEWFTDKFYTDTLVDASDDLENIFNYNLSCVKFNTNRRYYITRTLNISSDTNVIGNNHISLGGSFYDIYGDAVVNAIVTDKKIPMISWTPVGIRKLKEIGGFNLYNYYAPETENDLLDCEDISLFAFHVASNTSIWGVRTNINIAYLYSGSFNSHRVYLFSGFEFNIESGGYIYDCYINGSIIGCERALYCRNSGNVSDLYVKGQIRCCRGGWDGALNTLIIDCQCEPSPHEWKEYDGDKLFYFAATGGTIWCRNRIWDLRDEYVPYAIKANKVFYDDNDQRCFSLNGFPTNKNDVRFLNACLNQNIYTYKDNNLARMANGNEVYFNSYAVNTFAKGVLIVNGVEKELSELMEDWTGIFSNFTGVTIDITGSNNSYYAGSSYLLITNILNAYSLESTSDITSVSLIIEIKTYIPQLAANASNLAFLMLYNNYWTAEIEVKNVSSNEENYNTINISASYGLHKNSVYEVVLDGANYNTLDITYNFNLERITQIGTIFMNLPFAALCLPINNAITNAGGVINGTLLSTSYIGEYNNKSLCLYHPKYGIGNAQVITNLNTEILLANFYVSSSDAISFDISIGNDTVRGYVDCRTSTILDSEQIINNRTDCTISVKVYTTNVLYQKHYVAIYITATSNINYVCVNKVVPRYYRISFYDLDYKNELLKTIESTNSQYLQYDAVKSPKYGQNVFDTFRNKAAWYTGESWVDVNGYSSVYRRIGTTSTRPSLEQSDDIGYSYFDTTLGKPIWWNGSSWVTWENSVQLTSLNYNIYDTDDITETLSIYITKQDNTYYLVSEDNNISAQIGESISLENGLLLLGISLSDINNLKDARIEISEDDKLTVYNKSLSVVYSSNTITLNTDIVIVNIDVDEDNISIALNEDLI